MSKKLIGNNIDPKCAYCVFGEITADGKNVLCPKKGVMQPDGSCKKFSYDPLKREPERPARLPEFSSEDFSL
ncbi:MAG: hypothetical protein IJS90_03935 [Clostridia bacterium]|nr:hypothetical protein [Clostridia bacterium]